MQTIIKLQESFSYSLFPIILTVLFIIGIIYYKNNSKKVHLSQLDKKEISEKNLKDKPVIKNKYLKELDEIEKNFFDQKIDLRTAYQKISEIIRLFVFEMTDITTQNYSLKEIKKLNIPILYELIEEYYVPEFASKPVGDFEESIKKARGVIKEWN